MKLKLSPKNPRILLDEYGNELFTFTGTHVEDLRQVLARVNDFEKSLENHKKYGWSGGHSTKNSAI